jgi:hypothetical protein
MRKHHPRFEAEWMPGQKSPPIAIELAQLRLLDCGAP